MLCAEPRERATRASDAAAGSINQLGQTPSNWYGTNISATPSNRPLFFSRSYKQAHEAELEAAATLERSAAAAQAYVDNVDDDDATFVDANDDARLLLRVPAVRCRVE